MSNVLYALERMFVHVVSSARTLWATWLSELTEKITCRPKLSGSCSAAALVLPSEWSHTLSLLAGRIALGIEAWQKDPQD